MQAPLLSWILAALALATFVGVRRIAAPGPLARPALILQGAPLDAAPGGGTEATDDPAPRDGILEPDGSLALERLAFDDYDPPELRGEPVTPFQREDFPAEIAALDGQVLTVRGFPLVTQFAGERTDRLLLTRFPPGCCFGSVPVIDEWLAVTLAEGTPPVAGYDPIALSGRLRVGEILDENGFVESLYRLEEARIVED